MQERARAARPAAPAESGATVAGIFIAPAAGAPVQRRAAVELIPGVGIAGDRYATGRGHWSDPRWHDKQLTLVEAEVAEELGIAPEALRRNLVTRGVSLHGLIGVRFRIGEVLVAGVRSCDPCMYIGELNGRTSLRRELGARGGLRARVITAGTIHEGDPIEVVGLDDGVAEVADGVADAAAPVAGHDER